MLHHTAPTRPNWAHLGCFLHRPGPNMLLVVPDVRTALAAHSATIGGWPGANVKMGELNSANAPGGQSLP